MKQLLITILIITSNFLSAQELKVLFRESPASATLTGKIQQQSGIFRDSIDLTFRLNTIRTTLFGAGYLLSKASLSITQDSNYVLAIDPGPLIYQNQLAIKYPEGFVLPPRSTIRSSEGFLNLQRLAGIIDFELRLLENNGYPFASIELEDYRFENDTLKGQISLTPGPYVQIDSIIIKGFDGFPRNVLRYDFELKPGMAYDEALLQSLPQKAQLIEYLNMTRPPAVAFTPKKTLVYLYLEEVKSNQVDGVLGLNTTEDGEITLNGDFRLRLLNVIKKGEDLEIRWRRPDENVQSLDLGVEIPYFLKTPFWIEGDLSIFRQDSSFVNSEFQGLLKYLIESGSFLSGGVKYRSSNVLLNSDLNALGYNAFRTTFYKLGLEIRKTNRSIVPTDGFKVVAYGLTGSRKTEESSLDQYSYEFFGDYYFDIARHVIKLGVQSQTLFGEGLFLNEIYRIGGLRTLRGFNEQSIFSSSYAIGTAEYRYMIGEYDYLTVFADVAWSETNTINQYLTNVFTGIGAGINFRTGAGIFSLFYALGRSNDTSFDLRTSKVHFGYVNRF